MGISPSAASSSSIGRSVWRFWGPELNLFARGERTRPIPALAHRRFKTNDRLVRSGPAQFFARQPFQLAGIVLHGVNLRVELAGQALFLRDVGIKRQNI